MFKTGEYVVKANYGVCRIGGISKEMLSEEMMDYYVLIPLKEKGMEIFVPVEQGNQKLRKVMNREQAVEFIRGIRDINEVYIEDEKTREKVYKNAIKSCDPKKLAGVIKTLYLRKTEREKSGKKTTQIDERYFKLAENSLHSELAIALQVEKEKVEEIIRLAVENRDTL